MADLIGGIVPYGVGVALSPLPVIATVLLLMAPAGTRGAAAFLVARIVGLAALVAVATVVIELIDSGFGSTFPAAIVQLLVGAVLVVVAVLKWRSRPRGDAEPELPGWMRSIESASAGKAFVMGLLLTIANLKEIGFAAGAGLAIGSADVGVGGSLVAGIVFVVLAVAGSALPTVAALILGPRIAQTLTETRTWLVRNQQMLIAIVLLIVGALLIGAGIAEF